MSVELEVAVRDLRLRPLADPKQHLKLRGRDRVLQELTKWQNVGSCGSSCGGGGGD